MTVSDRWHSNPTSLSSSHPLKPPALPPSSHVWRRVRPPRRWDGVVCCWPGEAPPILGNPWHNLNAEMSVGRCRRWRRWRQITITTPYPPTRLLPPASFHPPPSTRCRDNMRGNAAFFFKICVSLPSFFQGFVGWGGGWRGGGVGEVEYWFNFACWLIWIWWDSDAGDGPVATAVEAAAPVKFLAFSSEYLEY